MRLRGKILSVILILVAVGVVSPALALSHDSPCGPAPPLPSTTQLMKAIVYRCYSSPDVLKFEDIESRPLRTIKSWSRFTPPRSIRLTGTT